MKAIIALGFLWAGFSTTLLADGGETRNGGDSACSEFNSFVARIHIAALDIGQMGFDAVNPKIQVHEIARVRKDGKCLPVEDLDREARSDREQMTVYLDRNKWAGLNLERRTRLAAHEVSVLLSYEGEGEYHVSDELFRLLLKTPLFESLALSDILPEGPEIRFSVTDTKSFLKKSKARVSGINEILQHLRAIAIEGTSDVMGASDRAMLNLAFRRQRDGVKDLIEGAVYIDEYGDSYQYLNEGIQIRGLKKLGSGLFISRRIQIKPTTPASLGRSARKTLPLNASLDAQLGQIFVNRVSISPTTKHDDTLSSVAPASSAIAVAKVINAKSGQTGVMTDIEPAILPMGRYFAHHPDCINPTGDNLMLNAVQVTWFQVDTVNALIEGINAASSLSGVKARLQSGSTETFELYTIDGRNISLKFGTENMNQCFPDLPKEREFLKAGEITLRSSYPIHIIGKEFKPLQLNGELHIDIDPEVNLNSANVLSQKASFEALTMLDQTLTQMNEILAELY